MTDSESVLLVGAGQMAEAYLEVLSGLQRNVQVVGRGGANLRRLKERYPENGYYEGGLDKFLAQTVQLPDFAINCVDVSNLTNITTRLLRANIRRILVEKPGGLSYYELKACAAEAEKRGTQVCVAFNRRHYASVLELVDLIEKDGGLLSMHFDFTELTGLIGPHTHADAALNRWVLSNSAHVIDTAFHLAGMPTQLQVHVAGRDLIPWHPDGAIFCGNGMTEQKVPFTYHANWKSAGRWSIEAMTQHHKFILCPMEELKMQEHGSFNISRLEINSTDDQKYKPGLLRQTRLFLSGSDAELLSLDSYLAVFRIISNIAGYDLSARRDLEN